MSKHSCAAVVVRCIDFRISPRELSHLLSGAGLCHDGDYDLVSVAGAGKDLLSDTPGERDFILKQIDISKRLHDSKDIYILMHENCGAYGISDAAVEDKTQADDLKRIATDFKTRFPEMTVHGVIIKGVPTGNLSLEQIV